MLLARRALEEHNQLKRMDGAAQAAELGIGDFVEFTAKFKPSQISSLLDIVTPELAETITRRTIHQKKIAEYTGGNAQKESRFKLELEGEKETWGAIARAATKAVRADFRSDATREYYGSVGSPGDQVTAITICDSEHFVVQDADRILDGTFTVLGKVTSERAEDLPILERNKILDRLNPKVVDEAASQLNGFVRESASKKVPAFGDEDRSESSIEGTGADMSDEVPFDLTLDSRIRGYCIKVIPIAIFI